MSSITEKISEKAVTDVVEYVLKSASGLSGRLSLDTFELDSGWKPGQSPARYGSNYGIPMIVGIIPPSYYANLVALKSLPQNQITDASLASAKNPDQNTASKKATIQAVNQLSDSDIDQVLTSSKQMGLPAEELAAAILASSGADPEALGLFGSNRAGIIQLTDDQIIAGGGGSPGTFVYAGAGKQLEVATNYFSNEVGDGNLRSATEVLMTAAGFSKDQITDPNAVLAEDPNPASRKADKSYKDRPDGRRPLKPGEKGYDAAVSAKQSEFDSIKGIGLRDSSRITTSDVANSVNNVKRTKAYQTFVDRINAARLSTLQAGGLNTSTGRIAGRAQVVGSVWGPDPTAANPSPTQSQGGATTAVDSTRQYYSATIQAKSINDQIDAIRNIPPLLLMVNPKTFSRNYERSYDYAKGRRGDIASLWLEKPMTISAQGETAGAYSVTVNGDNGGITGTQRVSSLAYRNLMSLVGIYKNNGMLYQGSFDVNSQGVSTIPLSVYIYYDGRVYVGSFDSFSVSDDAERPFSYSYNFTFTTRFEVQAYLQS